MRQITALALLVVVSACGGKSGSASPTAPNQPVSQPAGQQAQVSAGALAFPLLAGSFTIVNREGDQIVGTYTGTSRFSGAGSQAASVTLQIASGSGKLAGVIGSFTMNGVGSFADEGSFVLDGHGQVAFAGGKRATVVLNLRGRSVATCSTSERILISQTAAGVLGHAGRVTATLSHEVGNTGCIS